MSAAASLCLTCRLRADEQECVVCESHVCSSCRLRVPWDNGGPENDLCDACDARARREHAESLELAERDSMIALLNHIAAVST